MSFETQLNGLNNLLVVIYGQGTSIRGLLHELGFEQAQADRLEGEAFQALACSLIEYLQRRLAGPNGQDTYFHVLSSRYGLDGEPARSMGQVAQERGLDEAYLRQLFPEILDRCRTRTMQADLKKELKRLAAAGLAQSPGGPTHEQVSEKLERLSNLHAAADVTRLDYEAKRNEILAKVQAELDALEMEYQPLMDTVQENIDELEIQIKTDVLLHGESVSGGTYRAVFSKGRVGWDNKGMEKYAQLHPDVLKFRTEGQPIVSLRVINAKD